MAQIPVPLDLGSFIFSRAIGGILRGVFGSHPPASPAQILDRVSRGGRPPATIPTTPPSTSSTTERGTLRTVNAFVGPIPGPVPGQPPVWTPPTVTQPVSVPIARTVVGVLGRVVARVLGIPALILYPNSTARDDTWGDWRPAPAPNLPRKRVPGGPSVADAWPVPDFYNYARPRPARPRFRWRPRFDVSTIGDEIVRVSRRVRPLPRQARVTVRDVFSEPAAVVRPEISTRSPVLNPTVTSSPTSSSTSSPTRQPLRFPYYLLAGYALDAYTRTPARPTDALRPTPMDPELGIPGLTPFQRPGLGSPQPLAEPQSRSSRCECQQVKRRTRKRGKCRQGYFSETATGTKYITWSTRRCP